jgi:high-affinity Fe2+/Pb2+ permease
MDWLTCFLLLLVVMPFVVVIWVFSNASDC